MHARAQALTHACRFSWAKYPTASALIIQCLRACVRACVLTRARVCAWVKCVALRVRAYVRPSMIIVEIGKQSPGVFPGERGTPGRGLGVVMVSSCLTMH